MMGTRVFLILSVFALASCGRQADLEPASGHKMPVRPAMARTAPTTGELLTPPTSMRPNRVDELVKKSQPRPADPFDLPPPTGGAAPSLPAGTGPDVVNNSTAATPGG